LYEFVIDMLKSFNPIQITVPNEALLLLQCAKHHHETPQLDVVQQTMHPTVHVVIQVWQPQWLATLLVLWC